MITTFFIHMGELFLAMAPYLVLGLVFAGIIHAGIKEETITRLVGKNSLGSVLRAALFGVPLPLCSCGVVPTALSLERSGASRSAVVSFLISTPQTGVDSILASYGMLGPFMAIYRPVTAGITGILGGGLNLLIGSGDARDASMHDDEEEAEGSCQGACCSCSAPEEPSGTHAQERSTTNPMAFIKKAWHFGFVETLDDIAWPFLVGLVIAALITALLPAGGLAESPFSSGILGMLTLIVISIPMYVCSTSSIPVAVALMVAGFSPGTAFVFLSAGPATNAATLTILRSQFGMRMTVVYLVAIITGAMGFGLLLDMLAPTLGSLLMIPEIIGTGEVAGEQTSMFIWVVSGLFALALLRALLNRLSSRLQRG